MLLPIKSLMTNDEREKIKQNEEEIHKAQESLESISNKKKQITEEYNNMKKKLRASLLQYEDYPSQDTNPPSQSTKKQKQNDSVFNNIKQRNSASKKKDLADQNSPKKSFEIPKCYKLVIEQILKENDKLVEKVNKMTKEKELIRSKELLDSLVAGKSNLESFGLSIILEEKLLPKQKLLVEKEKKLIDLQIDKAILIDEEFYIKYREKNNMERDLEIKIKNDMDKTRKDLLDAEKKYQRLINDVEEFNRTHMVLVKEHERIDTCINLNYHINKFQSRDYLPPSLMEIEFDDEALLFDDKINILSPISSTLPDKVLPVRPSSTKKEVPKLDLWKAKKIQEINAKRSEHQAEDAVANNTEKLVGNPEQNHKAEERIKLYNTELTKIKKQYHLEMVQSRKIRQKAEKLEERLQMISKRNSKLISLNKIYQSKWSRLNSALSVYGTFYKKNYEWLCELYEEAKKRGIITTSSTQIEEYMIDSPDKFLRNACRRAKLKPNNTPKEDERMSNFLEYQDELLNDDEDSEIPSEEESYISGRIKSEKDTYIEYLKRMASQLQDRLGRVQSNSFDYSDNDIKNGTDRIKSLKRLYTSPNRVEGHRVSNIRKRGNPILPPSKPNIYKLLPKEPINMSFKGLNDSSILNFESSYESDDDQSVNEIFTLNLSQNPLKRKKFTADTSMSNEPPLLHSYNISLILQSNGDLEELEQSLRKHRDLIIGRTPVVKNNFFLQDDSFDKMLRGKL